MTNILVTGGSGFIGSHLCDALVEKGHTVVCYDNLSTGRRENIAHLEDKRQFHFIHGDVTGNIVSLVNQSDCPQPEEITQVYHLASPASPADFESSSIEIALTNSIGTRSVLEFASEYDARVVYASTSEVYGDPKVHPQSEDYNGNVSIRDTRSCYDVSKRFGEMLSEEYSRHQNVDIRTIRIFNTYGPRMRPDDGRVIPTFVRQGLRDNDLTIYGDGTQTRSFLYIDDLVQALYSIMNKPGLSGEVVNVGSVEEMDINTLAETISSIIENNTDVRYEPLPHENDPKRRKPDIAKARELLDWIPQVPLETGLERTVAYFRTQLTAEVS